MKFVIMAGGIGSKLWPLSRAKTPKQFIKLVGGRSLFQMTVDSLVKRHSVEDIFVSTTEDLVGFVEEQYPSIPKENYIVEPEMRLTGPASVLAMAKVAKRFPDEVIYFYVQCVIVREPEEKFLDMIEMMEKQVRQTGKFMTGMMVPKYTEVGSDLFKMGKKLSDTAGMNVYEVEEFINVVKERMTLEQVEEISRKFTVGIHTNHYVWRPKEFFESLQKIRPDWFDLIEELMKYLDTDKEKEKLEEIYKKFEPDRIEVLTTELIKENKLLAVELPFDWTHITTWDDVYRYRENKKMPLDNGKVVNVESEGNMVMASDKKVVAMVGMKDMVVVDTDDALLIMPRSMASKIKEAGDILEEKGFKDYL